MKYKTYPKMKDSGVEWIGDIPEEWEVTKIRRLVESIKSGVSRYLSNEDIGYPILRSGNIKNGNLNFSEIKYWYKDDTKGVDLTKYILQENDILLNFINSLAQIGKSCLFSKQNRDWIYTTNIFRIQIDENVVSSQYFYLLLNSLMLQHQIKSITQPAVNQASFTKDDLKQLFVIIPSQKEQKQISKFLDQKITNIVLEIEKNKKLVTLLQEKRQSTINRAITKGLDDSIPMKDSGIEWIGDIPESWNINYLKYVMNKMVAGPFGSSIKKEEYVEKGYKVYGQEQVIPNDFSIGDYYISENKFQELKRFQINSDDILISCVGTFGKIAIVPKDIESGIINPRLIKLTPNNKLIHSDYLFEFLKSPFAFAQLEKDSHGGTMDIINLGLLSSIMLPIPPLNEQKLITIFLKNKINSIEKLKIKTQTQIEKLQELRQSLISSAVTGKIYVTN